MPRKRTPIHIKEVKIVPRKFDATLLLWGIVASLLCLVAFLVKDGPEVNMLFAYSILVTIVVGALGSTIYIAWRGGSVK